MMITWSPTSMYGTYCGFSLPLNTSAALVARRPSVLPLASTTNHLRSTFLPLGIKVPISLLPSKRLKNPEKPAQSALARAYPAHGPTAVSQLLYPETSAIKCHLPQENDTQH